jgi:ribonuclease HI
LNPLNIEIYTDGSCNPERNNGAWASVILFAGGKNILKGEEINTTHNRMELLAVIESIKFCDENRYNGHLIIYSDSQYVCRITERKDKLKQNQFITKKGTLLQNADLVQILIQQIESHTIRFIKVKAHQKEDSDASKYNNQVDQLSRNLVRQKDKI